MYLKKKIRDLSHVILKADKTQMCRVSWQGGDFREVMVHLQPLSAGLGSRGANSAVLV